jgi:ribosome maturation factor RimP
VAGETTITVQPDDGSEARTLAYVDVERARTVFEWGPAPKPGTSKSPSAKNPSAKNPSAKKKAAKP